MDQKTLTVGHLEEQRKLRKEFSAIDENGDGKVDKTEMD